MILVLYVNYFVYIYTIVNQNTITTMKTYLHPITNEVMTKEEFFNFMFGEEFMESEDKGTLKEYEV